MEHPGLELEKRINECGMSRKELALRTGVTEKHISTVINGERGISTGFARKLGYVWLFGHPCGQEMPISPVTKPVPLA